MCKGVGGQEISIQDDINAPFTSHTLAIQRHLSICFLNLSIYLSTVANRSIYVVLIYLSVGD